MELHRDDVQALEGTIAKAARVIATFQKHLGPIFRPELSRTLGTLMSDLVNALCLLDPAAASKDFDAHVRDILDREGRKASMRAG